MIVKTRRFATLALSICLAFAASLASAGYYYESVSEGSGQGQGQYTKTMGWVEGGKARVEFASGAKDGVFADGNYLVTTDGGENVYLINPKDETYAKFNLDAMMASLGQAMNMMEQMGGMVKMEITDPSSEKVLEEPGGSLMGYSTTHYRYESGYTMSLSVMGMKQQNRSDSMMDIWSTSEIQAPGFGVWLRPDRQLKTGNEELDKMLSQQFDKMQGFPLKMVMETTTTNKKGRSQSSTMTMAVTALREESVSDDKFAWPDHYTETEVLPTDLDATIRQQAQDSKKKNKKRN